DRPACIQDVTTVGQRGGRSADRERDRRWRRRGRAVAMWRVAGVEVVEARLPGRRWRVLGQDDALVRRHAEAAPDVVVQLAAAAPGPDVDRDIGDGDGAARGVVEPDGAG